MEAEIFVVAVLRKLKSSWIFSYSLIVIKLLEKKELADSFLFWIIDPHKDFIGGFQLTNNQ